jgi:hypothetical protein
MKSAYGPPLPASGEVSGEVSLGVIARVSHRPAPRDVGTGERL